MFKRSLVLGLILFLAIFVVSPAGAAIVAQYTFDNSLAFGEGGTYDLSLYGSPAAASSSITGGAIEFDGVDDYLRTTNTTAMNALYPAASGAGFTVSLWAKADTVSTAWTLISPRYIKRGGYVVYTSASTKKWYVGTYSGQDDGDPGAVYGLTGPTITADQWTHLVFSFNPASETDAYGGYKGTGTFYIDGIAYVSSSEMYYRSPAPFGGYCVGSKYAGTGTFYDGSVDDLCIQDGGVMSASKIAAIHAMGLFEAESLASSAINNLRNAFSDQGSVLINGHNWAYKTGLAGVLGTTGGSIIGNDAFVILDNSGNGMMIPEPATIALLCIGSVIFVRKQR